MALRRPGGRYKRPTRTDFTKPQGAQRLSGAPRTPADFKFKKPAYKGAYRSTRNNLPPRKFTNPYAALGSGNWTDPTVINAAKTLLSTVPIVNRLVPPTTTMEKLEAIDTFPYYKDAYLDARPQAWSEHDKWAGEAAGWAGSLLEPGPGELAKLGGLAATVGPRFLRKAISQADNLGEHIIFRAMQNRGKMLPTGLQSGTLVNRNWPLAMQELYQRSGGIWSKRPEDIVGGWAADSYTDWLDAGLRPTRTFDQDLIDYKALVANNPRLQTILDQGNRWRIFNPAASHHALHFIAKGQATPSGIPMPGGLPLHRAFQDNKYVWALQKLLAEPQAIKQNPDRLIPKGLDWSFQLPDAWTLKRLVSELNNITNVKFQSGISDPASRQEISRIAAEATQGGEVRNALRDLLKIEQLKQELPRLTNIGIDALARLGPDAHKLYNPANIPNFLYNKALAKGVLGRYSTNASELQSALLQAQGKLHPERSFIPGLYNEVNVNFGPRGSTPIAMFGPSKAHYTQQAKKYGDLLPWAESLAYRIKQHADTLGVPYLRYNRPDAYMSRLFKKY